MINENIHWNLITGRYCQNPDAIGTRLPIPPPGLFPFAESSLQNELFQQTRFLILKLKNTIFIKVNLSSTLL
jgi:hypothetical protein